MALCFSRAARRFTLLTVLILGLQLPLSVDAKSSIDVRITSPQNEQKVGGQLKVEASISSEYELKEAKASVSGIEAPLFQSCSGCSTWTGTLNTSSLPQGPHSVIVNATDVKKKTGTASAPFVHDEAPPVVTLIELPKQHSIITDGSIHIASEATDEFATPVHFLKIYEDGNPYDPVIAESLTGNSYSRTFDVSAYTGTTLHIHYSIGDGWEPESYNLSNPVNYGSTVHIASLAALTAAERIPNAEILDSDANRLLINRSGSLYIRSRTNGTETPVAGGHYPVGLTPNGAVTGSLAQPEFTVRLHSWNGNSVAQADLGQWDRSSAVTIASNASRIQGKYLLSAFEGTVYWINTETNEVRKIPDFKSPYSSDITNYEVMDDGDLLMSGSSMTPDTIFRYYAATGQTEPFLTFPYPPFGPISDGETILFYAGGALQKYRDGSVTSEVYGIPLDEFSVPSEFYQYSNGWLAYVGENHQAYLKSPEGTVTQVTYLQKPVSLHALGEDGTLIVKDSPFTYHLYRPGQEQLIEIGSNRGARVDIHDGQVHYLLGDTIFYVSQAPENTQAFSSPAAHSLSLP
ncbi:hypothetical protein ACVNS2_19470 [Paenibacillus caseinilyticus]|uniref:Uncharacterized protein n=1 Tax=Paenibacillus mucilaginosus K02 TaxID=997761 RepID=I0BKE3_9BACL|nr:hypothetical protein [Paenibacillus mucilaginosus]AFH62840.1 hypothetical protein B2K_19325 [Paenibacillus mucilaginosus K02]